MWKILSFSEFRWLEERVCELCENVWKEGDDLLFEQQLMELADKIIDEGKYVDNACSFFSENMGKPMDCKLQNGNWCGAGKMLSIDAAGNFYPCTRFAQYSLRDKEAWIIGNIHDGIDNNKLRPFLTHILGKYIYFLPYIVWILDLFQNSKTAWKESEPQCLR